MSAPRALVICHSAHEGSGRVGERLRERGYELDLFTVVDDPLVPVSHAPFPDATRHDLISVFGAPWSVYDNETIGSWITRELELLRTAHERGVPVLGICFGAQALAAALGGTVARAPRSEVGWHEIDSDVPWIAAGPWFQWHHDRFTLPAGATELARSAVAPQAFSCRRSLGVQFHPEVDLAIVRDWLEGRRREESEFAAAGVDPQVIAAAAPTMVERTRSATDRLVDGFLDLVATAD
jgi:GMP synthase-like glutamine amidotransferase